MAQSSVQRASLLGGRLRHRLVDVLTPREYAIAALAATGLSNQEIARQLGLTEVLAPLVIALERALGNRMLT